nr:uncharacterized protein LOC112282811 [Physcomitrium patens]|eukprot:XP_024376659.1 uncharacterized protein LOC112282811 [Physcomitrella patens]
MGTFNGELGESNSRPLAPEARIIPLDQIPAALVVAQVLFVLPAFIREICMPTFSLLRGMWYGSSNLKSLFMLGRSLGAVIQFGVGRQTPRALQRRSLSPSHADRHSGLRATSHHRRAHPRRNWETAAVAVMFAMAVASPNSLLYSQPSHSVPCHSLSHQLRHQPIGQAVQIGKLRKERLCINASAETQTSSETPDETALSTTTSRRQLVAFPIASTCSYLAAMVADRETAIASDFASMPALQGKDYGKSKMSYPDYVQTGTGLQFKDLREGTGPVPAAGNAVVVDWDGYTIGYLGRIFEARNKAKGGSFEGDDKSFFRFKLGNSEVIPAFEEAVATMKVGGIRRIIVPPELGYPNNDFNQKGPRPNTFSGQRALDFVLRNQGLIDKTLLFDIELIKVVNN